MLLVEIEKPENEALSTWFAQLRDWLDRHRSVSSTFMPAGRRIDRLIYRILFGDAARAHQLLLDFARYTPIVRRGGFSERDQFREIATAPAARDTLSAGPAD